MANCNRPDVVFFYKNLGLGGVQRRTVQLANEFVARGLTVHVVTTQDLKDSSLVLHPSIYWTRLGHPRWLHAIKFADYLRRTRPRLIISATPYYNIVSIISRAIGSPSSATLITERSDTIVELKKVGLVSRIIILSTSIFYRFSDHVVAVSEGLARSASRVARIDPDRIQVIYNPVYHDGIRQLADEPVDIPWTSEPRTLLVGAGRLVEQKNFSLLIDAFALASKTSPELRLAILGEGDLRSQLEAQISRLGLEGKAVLCGEVTNPFPYFRAADLFVLSSSWEGFGNVVVEALATGCNVVATDCPSGPREILANGNFGRLATVDDVKSLAAEILEALKTPLPKQKLVNRAKEFSVSAAADRYLEYLH